MLVEKNITFYSNCEHHFVPIMGRAHIAYISSGKVIGLSKINRIVQYYARRPQVQERLTIQIANELKSVLNTRMLQWLLTLYIFAFHQEAYRIFKAALLPHSMKVFLSGRI
jgi:GTP cyclohydrolase I